MYLMAVPNLLKQEVQIETKILAYWKLETEILVRASWSQRNLNIYVYIDTLGNAW